MNIALARRYQAAHATLQGRIAHAIRSLWVVAPALTDDELAQFTARAVPIVSAAQTQMIGLASAYVGAYVGTAPPALDTEAITSDLRGGVPLTDVYSRPTITLRRLLAEGLSFADASARAGARLDATTQTDVQLASRAGASAAMEAVGVVGYRRVCSGRPCMLCLSASTQRYHARDLMPIHPRCSCTVAPIVGTEDPGHIIDHDLLQTLKANHYLEHLSDGSSSPTLDALRDQFVTHEHGELGPVLAVPGQHFTGEHDLAA